MTWNKRKQKGLDDVFNLENVTLALSAFLMPAKNVDRNNKMVFTGLKKNYWKFVEHLKINVPKLQTPEVL